MAQNLKQKKYFVRAAAAVLCAAAFLWTAGPALARLDELIIEDAPYVSPPSAAVSAARGCYEVRPGDTLWSIARENGLTVEALAAANGLLERDRIKAGQLLALPAGCATHRVRPGETLWDIARMYRVDVGTIAARNGLADSNSILAGQQLFVPLDASGAAMSFRRAAAWPLAWPLVGAVTSPFGMRDGKPHEGIDIAAEAGTPIRAAAPGRVVFAGPRGTYGLAVIIDHGNGTRTLYAHCSRILVSEGDSVGTSTIIALAGNTGRSNGPHLHLEVLKNGVPMDPALFLEQESYYG